MEKVHAVVARSTFRSQNVQSTTCSDHFWKLRCGKSARSCGAKHMSKSQCTKHTMFGPLLEVEMWKKVQVVVARSTFRSQNVQNTPCSDHFWKLRCGKSARCCGAKHMLKSIAAAISDCAQCAHRVHRVHRLYRMHRVHRVHRVHLQRTQKFRSSLINENLLI